MLLPGSEPGVRLFGSDVYGGYPASNVIWGIEKATDAKEGKNSGKEILSIDKGPFSADEGVFVQFTGTVTNTGHDSGFDTEYDTDPRPGVIGKTIYTLTYRIPANRPEIIQEVSLKVEENNFGPISSAVLALYIPGFSPNNLVYATNPEIMPISEELQLKNVEINKYFRNTCVKKVFFYDVDYKSHRGKKYVAQTPAGRGRIACVGAPDSKMSFVCGYPNNDYIPKETYEEYVLEISDNQNFKRYGKFNTINYKLLSSPNKTLTFKRGDQLLLIMRYKFIDATGAIVQSTTDATK